MKSKLLKKMTLFNVFGTVYMSIEIIYTALMSGSMALKGHTSLWMYVLGGILGTSLGAFNERRYSVTRRYWLEVLVAGLLVTVLEFASGCILNLWLGFDLWDYQDRFMNLMGQINIMHSIYWVILSPFAFWLDDLLRFYMYKEERPPSFIRYYQIHKGVPL